MEKTVLINCSPKKHLSASGFLAKCAGLLIRGKKEYLHLRTPADRAPILEALKSADKAVFVMPLYVDGTPSHVLPFLKEAEAFCRENGLNLKVYVIANNGFIEGRQNEPMMQVMENFCARSGLEWCGGIGIGGGVMLNVERIVLTVEFAVMIVKLILCATRGQSLLGPLRSFGISVLELLFFASAILVFAVRLVLHINKGTDAGKRYTRILLPSFLFIIVADIFFTIISILRGGIFRGWLSRPEPDADCRMISAQKN